MYGEFEVPMTDTRRKTLLRDLDGKTPARMNKALEILIDSPDEKIVDELLKEVKKTDKTIRKNAVIILGHKDDRRVEGALIKILREEKNGEIKREICKVLGNIGKSREAVEALLELSGNGDTELTVKAHAAIGKIRKRRYRVVERIDLPHNGGRETFATIDALNRRFEEINEGFKRAEIVLEEIRADRMFMKNSGELLDKMREFSERKSPALKRAEQTFEKIKGKRARA